MGWEFGGGIACSDTRKEVEVPPHNQLAMRGVDKLLSIHVIGFGVKPQLPSIQTSYFGYTLDRSLVYDS